jgi:hypothetical protein
MNAESAFHRWYGLDAMKRSQQAAGGMMKETIGESHNEATIPK